MLWIKGAGLSHNHESFWWSILIIGLGTFLLRFSFIWAFGRGDVRPEITRALRFVPAAVLAALVAPSIIFLQGTTSFSISNERFWAGIIAVVVAWRANNMFLTLSSGMVALWLMFVLKGSF